MGWTKWRGDELIKRTETATMKALNDTAEEIGAEADQQVPHDEGWLQESKTILDSPNELAVHIGYGGGEQSGKTEVPYALRHHEVPQNFHKGRKHNYLRDPVKTIGPKAELKNLKITLRKAW